MGEAENTEDKQWYAMRVRYGHQQQLVQVCRERELDFFAPTGVISTLLFVRCSEAQLQAFVEAQRRYVWVYYNASGTRPAAIDEKEMEVFRFVVTAGREGLTLLGDDKPEYHEGELVRVTGGPFKGAVGHIRRIKRDRRLVVSISGVVAVATTYIHPLLLQRVASEEAEREDWLR